MLPLIYPKGVKATIGHDAGTAESIVDMGMEHVEATVDSVVIDKDNQVVSTPAYMLATSISEAAMGISRLVKTVISMS
jgi:enhancing lycopene biosynthesis protein 2